MWTQQFAMEEQKPYYKALQKKVEQAYQTKTVYPPQNQIFTAFDLCPFEQVKVVILGQDPYHDEHQAHGLAFSVQKGCKIPPSLRNIFKELKNDINMDPPDHGDLSAWAKQGVLLLNTILTVEAHRPLSHKDFGWETFTDHIISLLNQDSRPKVFVLWGNSAQKKTSLITNPIHMIHCSSHPSPLSARHSFFGSRVFSKINTFLMEHELQPIDFTIK